MTKPTDVADDMNCDRATIAALYDKYASVLFDKCVRILGDSALAEDAVQQTYINAYVGLATYTHGNSHLPWLYSIATNVCFKMLKKHRRLELKEDDQALEAHMSILEGVNDTATIEVQRMMTWAGQTFDERNQQIFVAVYVDGMNQVQIADALGISRRAVVKRLAHIRASVEDLKLKGGL